MDGTLADQEGITASNPSRSRSRDEGSIAGRVILGSELATTSVSRAQTAPVRDRRATRRYWRPARRRRTDSAPKVSRLQYVGHTAKINRPLTLRAPNTATTGFPPRETLGRTTSFRHAEEEPIEVGTRIRQRTTPASSKSTPYTTPVVEEAAIRRVLPRTWEAATSSPARRSCKQGFRDLHFERQSCRRTVTRDANRSKRRWSPEEATSEGEGVRELRVETTTGARSRVARPSSRVQRHREPSQS